MNFIGVTTLQGGKAIINVEEIGSVIDDIVKGKPMLHVQLRNNVTLSLQNENLETFKSKIAQATKRDHVDVFDTPSKESLSTLYPPPEPQADEEAVG